MSKKGRPKLKKEEKKTPVTIMLPYKMAQRLKNHPDKNGFIERVLKSRKMK